MALHDFEADLRKLINTYSIENDSNTPDFLLAQYLVNCLTIFNTTMQARWKWLGGVAEMIQADLDPGEMDGDAQSALASAGHGTDEDYGGTDERI